ALVQAGGQADGIRWTDTEVAARVGPTYRTMTFGFFIMLSFFDGIGRRVLEASADLGAGPARTFAEVLLPLTRSGILIAFSQSFIWAMGTYATPSALGPNTLWTIGYLVQEQMLGKHNWPMAAALSMILVVGVAAVMIFTRSLMAKRTAFHG